jgi:hypothetical protein
MVKPKLKRKKRMPKPASTTATYGYLLIGSGLQGSLSEIRGVFTTQEEAAAEAEQMSAQPSIVIVEVNIVETIASADSSGARRAG